MEKKSKSKSIFSLFSLDWDDKSPKSKADKPMYKASKVSGKDGGHKSSHRSDDPDHERHPRSRSSQKEPPQPAPRIHSKSAKLAEKPSAEAVVLSSVTPSTSSKSAKRHSGTVRQRTQSPFPSPHLTKKTLGDIVTYSPDRGNHKSDRRSDTELAEGRSITRKTVEAGLREAASTVNSTRENARLDTVSAMDVAGQDEAIFSKRQWRMQYQSKAGDRPGTAFNQEDHASQMHLSRDHTDSSSPTTSKASPRSVVTRKQTSQNRREQASPTVSPSASTRRYAPQVAAELTSLQSVTQSFQDAESQSGPSQRKLSKRSTANPPTGRETAVSDTLWQTDRQAPGYHRHLELRERDGASSQVNDRRSDQQSAITDNLSRGNRKTEHKNGFVLAKRTAFCGSTRNLSVQTGPDIRQKKTRNNGLRLFANDLTFETAILSLIRLRRLETRLRHTRDRYLAELQLFRGWSDDRHIHVLDQIAKSNHQMDELDPLIASLEEFINDQQTPQFIPEDEVLRYPVSFDTRQMFTRSNRINKSAIHGRLSPHSNETEGFLNSYMLNQASSSEAAKRSPKSQSVGRNALILNDRAYQNNRPTILPPKLEQADIDKELEALTYQVRQLQMQSNNLQNGIPRQADADGPRLEPLNHTLVEPPTRRAPEPFQSEPRRIDQWQTERTAPQPLNGESADAQRVKSSGHNSSSLTSTASSSDEVSVDEPYQYEDFTDTALYESYLDDSLTKLQNVMRDLEDAPHEVDIQTPIKAEAVRDYSNTQQEFPTYRPYQVHENGLPENLAYFGSGHPPMPPVRKPKAGPASKIRRHHTISSGSPSAIYAARAAYGERYSDNEALSDDVVPSRKSSLDDEDSVSYDFQIRLNSPDPIAIPERYLDVEGEVEQEDESAIKHRRAKAEDIRRMLAVPEPGSSDRDQRDREKVLLMTPILAREVTERSRRVALQARNRANGR